MPLPSLTKTWTFSNNNRIVFVSQNDAMSKLLFGIKNFLVSTMLYTVKYTCDGTTGPTSSSDHTDRWASAANCTTRGTATNTAQSFAVLTDGNGVDILLTYQGAADTQAKFSISPTGVFLPAATANQQPTATDEAIVVANNAVYLGSNNANDRVWNIQASTDKKLFRVMHCCAGTFIYVVGVELVTRDANMVSSFTWSPVVVGWATNQTTLFAAGSANGTTATSGQGLTRINTTNATLGGTCEYWDGVIVAQPELQAFSPIITCGLYSNLSPVIGRIGDRIDLWSTPMQTPLGQGDTFGTLQFVWFGSYVFPWDGVSNPVTT